MFLLLTMFTISAMLGSVMESTETTNDKVQIAARVDPALFAVIDRFRSEEDRNLSNMIERLLKTHPRIQEVLEAGPATVAAN